MDLFPEHTASIKNVPALNEERVKFWHTQGDILGTLAAYERETMNNTPTSDPGSVAIRIARSNQAKAEVNRKANCISCTHKITLSETDKVIKDTGQLRHIRKDGHTWLEDSEEIQYLNMVYPG